MMFACHLFPLTNMKCNLQPSKVNALIYSEIKGPDVC